MNGCSGGAGATGRRGGTSGMRAQEIAFLKAVQASELCGILLMITTTIICSL